MHDAFPHRRPAKLTPRQTHPFKLSGLALLIALISQGALADTDCPSPEGEQRLQAQSLDWVPLEHLSDAERARLPTACCGAYVSPKRDDPDAEALPSESLLRARADISEARLGGEVVMSGNVEITQGYRSIRADSANYNQTDRQAAIAGNIQIREPGLLLKAEQAEMDIDQGNASLDQAEFVLHETRIRGQAKRLEKLGNQLIRLTGSRFTSCEPGSNLWEMAGSDIRIYPEDHYGTARHMRLEVLNIPVIYLPYARFPVGKERLTGFLFPSLSLDSDSAIADLEVPFYWNMAPNYDLTLVPRYMDEHGAILSSEFRHLSPNFETLLNTSYLHEEKGNYRARDKERIEEGLKTDYTGDRRWLMQLLQTGGKGKRWNSRIDYTDLSDTDYLRDINSSAIDANRQAYISQEFALGYRATHWRLGVKGQEYRLLTETQLPYRELPRTHANGAYKLGDWRLQLNHEYVRFDRNSHFETNPENLVPGERLRTDYRLYWEKDWIFGFFKPGIAWRSLSYQLEENQITLGKDTQPSWHNGQASLDTGLVFERELQLGDQAYRQTLEPRLFYLYSDYVDQTELDTLGRNGQPVNFDTALLTFNYNQLFRHTRFAGGDRLDDANQVTVGVSSAWIQETTGLERLRVSVGQITYLETPLVSLVSSANLEEEPEKSSPVAAQITGQLNDNVRLTTDLRYDHRNRQLTGASLGLRYRDDNYRIFNIAYRYNRQAEVVNPSAPLSGRPQDQLDVSTLWPVTDQWSLIARSHYDFHHQLELDTFAGLEYNDCCYRIQFMARRWLDFDYSDNFLALASSKDYREGVFMDIQLKGLGNLGERVGKLLDKAIFGYREREQSLR